MEKNLRLIVAENIRTFRKAQNLTQEKLSELSGLHRTYITEVEKGTRNISIDNVEKLANALKISPAELVTNKIEKDKNENV